MLVMMLSHSTPISHWFIGGLTCLESFSYLFSYLFIPRSFRETAGSKDFKPPRTITWLKSRSPITLTIQSHGEDAKCRMDIAKSLSDMHASHMPRSGDLAIGRQCFIVYTYICYRYWKCHGFHCVTFAKASQGMSWIATGSLHTSPKRHASHMEGSQHTFARVKLRHVEHEMQKWEPTCWLEIPPGGCSVCCLASSFKWVI